MTPPAATIETPLGSLWVVASGRGLRALSFDPVRAGEDEGEASADLLRACREQLAAYFGGALRRFDLPLDPVGTPFQRRAWQALRDIPFGETRSYAAQAAAIGRPSAARAVGAANARNPLAIVVPCHRVVGAGGRLVGYAAGLERKRALLELEGAQPAGRGLLPFGRGGQNESASR